MATSSFWRTFGRVQPGTALESMISIDEQGGTPATGRASPAMISSPLTIVWSIVRKCPSSCVIVAPN
jgi:hypothetical protein